MATNHANPSPLTFICMGLGLLFIGLKLAKVITWAWWLVLSPLWGVALFYFVVFFVIAFLAELRKSN